MPPKSGKSKSDSKAQASCHGCGCGKTFSTATALAQHRNDKHSAVKIAQHKDDKHSAVKTEPSKNISSSQTSYKPPVSKNFTCLKCTSKFKTADSLKQHQKDARHVTEDVRSSKEARQLYVKGLYEKHVAVQPDDRKESVKVVKGTMDKIMHHVRGQEGGKYYSPNLVTAGSYASKTKIGKADEFDYVVPLNVDDVKAKQRGTLPYKFDEQSGAKPKRLKANCKLVDVQRPKDAIPKGYASVSAPEGHVPSSWTHHGDIIPQLVQKDLHQKMEYAIKDLGLDKKGVNLSREAHGPALTAKIKRPGKHDIDVDIAPSIPSNLPMAPNSWPRPATRKALSESQIAQVQAAGTHLVPKGDTTFAVSYSKQEKALLNEFDAGNGCRKKCHQVMKRYFQEFSSKSLDGAPGISTHILKHQLFNMNEKHPSNDYWHENNFGERLPDMMKDLEQVLRSGKLSNHFNPSENVLAGKNPKVLNSLANYIKMKREELP